MVNSKKVYALTSYLGIVSPLRAFSNNSNIQRSAFISNNLSRRSSSTATAFLPGTIHNNFTGTITTISRNMSSENSAVDIKSNLDEVNSRIADTVVSCNRPSDSVRLIAVSKTKPNELLMDAYNAGQRYFGENYAQELISKAKELPKDIKWHFIGPLQSNKAAALVKNVGLKQLACIETISTMKLANKLNNAVASINEESSSEDGEKLGIYVQVNTSGEDSKSGVNNAEDCISLVKDIMSACTNLRIDGLMTIGAPGDFSCFESLVECRKKVCEAVGVDEDSFALSMGMSGDFEEAIKRSATSVRVGSTLFGARDYSNKK